MGVGSFIVAEGSPMNFCQEMVAEAVFYPRIQANWITSVEPPMRGFRRLCGR
jgi:hypothetical protein